VRAGATDQRCGPGREPAQARRNHRIERVALEVVPGRRPAPEIWNVHLENTARPSARVRQTMALAAALGDGCSIVGGDFNTMFGPFEGVVAALEAAGLQRVVPGNERRMSPSIDHIFVRGVAAARGEVLRHRGSDHFDLRRDRVGQAAPTAHVTLPRHGVPSSGRRRTAAVPARRPSSSMQPSARSCSDRFIVELLCRQPVEAAETVADLPNASHQLLARRGVQSHQRLQLPRICAEVEELSPVAVDVQDLLAFAFDDGDVEKALGPGPVRLAGAVDRAAVGLVADGAAVRLPASPKDRGPADPAE
jgi:hypothetical protein